MDASVITPIILLGGIAAAAVYFANRHYRQAKEYYFEATARFAEHLATAKAYAKALKTLEDRGEDAAKQLVQDIMEDMETFQKEANDIYHSLIDEGRKK